MIAMVLILMLPWLVVGVGAWFVYRVLGSQQRRILARLDSIDRQLGHVSAAVQRRQMKDSLGQFLLQQQNAAPPPPSGLPAATPAPEFELPDLAGERHKLQDFRGRKLLLVFFNPGCGYCTKMAPELAALPVDGANGHAVPLVITTGTVEANRQVVEEHKLRCPVLLDAKGEIGPRYRMTGTPTGYLIDEQGVIASPLAVGSVELLALLEADAEPAKPRGKANRGLAASKLIRDGLKADTLAPPFRLPRLDGGELALEDLQGKPVLLVFSDPECGPCNAVTPQLEELHRRNPAVQVVMISRKDEEANHKKVAEHGLTFPVLLQKQWEISKLYGIFATPVGYLIDADGVIIRDVAKGGEAILDLLRPDAIKPPLAA
jgi:peroxiredoxin